MIHLHTIILGLIAIIILFLALLKIYFEEKREKKDSHDYWNNSDNWGKH
jgi:hypothetical protein